MNIHHQLGSTSKWQLLQIFYLASLNTLQPFFPFRVSKWLWPYPKALRQISSHFCAKTNPSVYKTNLPAHVTRISVTWSWVCSLHQISILAEISCPGFIAEPGPPGQRWGYWYWGGRCALACDSPRWHTGGVWVCGHGFSQTLVSLGAVCRGARREGAMPHTQHVKRRHKQ